MWPIILCSIVGLAIIGERFWSLQRQHVAPKGLVPQVWRWIQEGKLDKQRLDALRHNSPNPMVLSSGLAEALITTAAGLCVAIPAVISHRYFQGVVDELIIEMEEEAFRLLDVLAQDSEVDNNHSF